MKTCVKVFVVILMIIAILCGGTVGSVAVYDATVWDDASLYVLLEAYEASNSDLCFAAIKVKYDYHINRIYILFLLEFEKFNDDMLSGAVMNINGYGDVKIMADGTTEFDPEVYHAQLDAEYADNRSNSIIMETTLGVKNGIPETVKLDVSIIDTCGVRSNRFHVDITEIAEDDGGDSGEGEEAGSITSRSKTTKLKTTKVKTTKLKTTKVKTTKAKASKSAKADSEDENDEPEQIVINAGIDDGVEINNNRRKLTLAFCAAAALIAVASGCAVGIRSKEKHKK